MRRWNECFLSGLRQKIRGVMLRQKTEGLKTKYLMHISEWMVQLIQKICGP
jgi:hypothetical protein